MRPCTSTEALYRPGVAQRVGRGITLLFHDRGTRRGWVVSSTPWPHFTPGKDPVPIVQEAGWAPGPVWTGGKSRPHRGSIPNRPARSQSLHRLSYRVHNLGEVIFQNKKCILNGVLLLVLLNFLVSCIQSRLSRQLSKILTFYCRNPY